MSVSGGEITITEDDDGGTIQVRSIASGFSRYTSTTITAEQLYELATQILGWFGAVPLTTDDQHARSDALRAKIDGVLGRNESRCLDDDVDRSVVARELVRALDPRMR